MTKDFEKQMEFRGVISDKQKLISILEIAYTKATSEHDFYNRLSQQGMELYKRNHKVTGVKLKRKFRFKTLGYYNAIIQELDKGLSQNKRLDTIRRIREQLNERSKGREWTKGKDR